jgi:tripartite-type tricarboxylate transporter receptor subunit TctC
MRSSPFKYGRPVRRWLFAAATVVASGAYGAPAFAADSYPTKPVRLIVPYSAGGGSDVVARIVGQKLTETLGQTFVIDNRAGAAGMVGTDLAANAPSDGYTLLLADAAYTINSSYYTKQARYDAVKSFTPVALIADTPYLLMTNPGVPAATLKEFIALAKAQPGKINVGSSGNGSGSHLVGELFKLKAGVNLNHIPYKGSGPSTADVMGGQIQATFAGAAGVVTFVKGGRLKALVVGSAKRSALLPDVPTFAEQGFPDLVVTNWYGIVTPAGTPKPVVNRLYDEIARAIAQPDVRERLTNVALDPVTPSPDQFAQLIGIEIKRWAQVIKEANLKTE